MIIKDKVILVTGASGGIGRAVARILAGRGAKLSLVARSLEPMQGLASELKEANPEIIAIRADVTKRAEVEIAVSSTIERFGGLDIIVNNAGIAYFGRLESMKMSDFEKIVAVNIFGLLNVTQASLPHLKKAKGMIVNISSGLSKRALPFLSAYGGTKSLVDALSDGFRMELKDYGIRVLNYCPPETDTDFARNALRESGGVETGSGRKIARVDDVSRRIVSAIIREKREVVEGKFLKIMNFFAPTLLDILFYNVMVKKMKV